MSGVYINDLSEENLVPIPASSASPYGEDTQKYWDRRYQIFSLFDHGIKIDREGLYSTTPETFAHSIAEKLPGKIVLDAFCCVGGSAIAFAKHKRVIAVDIDSTKLAMAEHNAGIYGVRDRIEFLHRDIRDIINRTELYDCLYLDPAWGGPAYSQYDKFELNMFNPDGAWLMERALAAGYPFALRIPKNFNLKSLFDYGEDFFLHWSKLNGVKQFATAYFRCNR